MWIAAANTRRQIVLKQKQTLSWIIIIVSSLCYIVWENTSNTHIYVHTNTYIVSLYIYVAIYNTICDITKHLKSYFRTTWQKLNHESVQHV